MITRRVLSQVSYLRVGLIAANLSLAFALVFVWYANLFEARETGAFETSYGLRLVRPFGGEDRTPRLNTAFVASALQPRRFVPRAAVGTSRDEPPTPPEPEYGPGGPLEDDWELSMFLGRDDGTIAMVQLTYRSETAGPPTRARQALARRTSRRPEKPWSFFVDDRFIQHDTRELEIVAHAAGASGFEYSIPDVDGGP